MNRSRSNDSLDNGDDNIICSSSGSSSPTDFTSDDEASTSNISLLLNRQYSSKPSKSRASAMAEEQMKYAPNLLNLLSPQGYIDNVNQASTSFYNDRNSGYDIMHQHQPNARSLRELNRVRRMIRRNQHENKQELQPSELVGNICDSDNIENVRILPAGEQEQEAVLATSDHTTCEDLDELIKNYPSIGENSNHGVTADRELWMTLPNYQYGPTVQPIINRGMNSITVRLCSRLVECRNLIEVIEFIEINRALIDNLTRIVTREAPAFRNYDMSNYQTDYSIKESFNQNFWLDREPVVTTADGNCQYHAVSISLTGSEAYTPEVRLATAVAVIDNREWFDSMLKMIDRGTVLDLVHTIARSHSWGDETTLKAIAVAINRRIFLYTCNIGKKDYEMVKMLSKEELLDAFREKKYRGGTGIHTYADPLVHVSANNYIMLFHKSEHFIAVLPTTQAPTMFEPYNPIVPVFN